MANTSSSTSPKKRLMLWRMNPFVGIFLVGSFAAASYGGYILLSHYQESVDLEELLLADGRNYKDAPFDIVDAIHFCKMKTQLRYGEQLTQSYVDENSTRIDRASGIYKIFMVAHIGKEAEEGEKSVHCFVDPVERVVSHYRSWDRYQTSLVSKAIRFFK